MQFNAGQFKGYTWQYPPSLPHKECLKAAMLGLVILIQSLVVYSRLALRVARTAQRKSQPAKGHEPEGMALGLLQTQPWDQQAWCTSSSSSFTLCATVYQPAWGAG